MNAVEHVAVFLLWWSVWSLMDTYLLQYSPLSEGLIGCIGCVILLFKHVCKISDAALQKLPL